MHTVCTHTSHAKHTLLHCSACCVNLHNLQYGPPISKQVSSLLYMKCSAHCTAANLYWSRFRSAQTIYTYISRLHFTPLPRQNIFIPIYTPLYLYSTDLQDSNKIQTTAFILQWADSCLLCYTFWLPSSEMCKAGWAPCFASSASVVFRRRLGVANSPSPYKRNKTRFVTNFANFANQELQTFTLAQERTLLLTLYIAIFFFAPQKPYRSKTYFPPFKVFLF